MNYSCQSAIKSPLANLEHWILVSVSPTYPLFLISSNACLWFRTIKATIKTAAKQTVYLVKQF